jgi:hypothetical protein
MLRFYWKLAKEAPKLLVEGYSIFLSALGAIAFGCLLVPRARRWGENMMNWEHISAWWAVAPVGLLFLWGLLKANYKAHRELAEKLEAMVPRFNFAELLRSRNREIERIMPDLSNPTSLKIAHNQLADVQVRIVKTLHQANSQWKHAPAGWSTDLPILHAWAGLAQVFSERYPHEISSPFATLYEPTESGLEINQDTFPTVKEHAMNLTALIIREIEHPDLPKNEEDKRVFQNTVALYLLRSGANGEALGH